MVQSKGLSGHRVFLSGSIPDPSRWVGPYDAFEITDAVVAAVQAILTASGSIVCAVHPTIAPLLLNVASQFPLGSADEPTVLVYQSRHFEQALVAETRQMERTEGLGRIVWTPSAHGVDESARRQDSLSIMRRLMLEETHPVAAVFVGGMEGVIQEFEMFELLYPDRSKYPVAAPGGAAAQLIERLTSPLREGLSTSNIYPTLMQAIVDDVVSLLEGPDIRL
jgi:hypothetical protein